MEPSGHGVGQTIGGGKAERGMESKSRWFAGWGAGPGGGVAWRGSEDTRVCVRQLHRLSNTEGFQQPDLCCCDCDEQSLCPRCVLSTHRQQDGQRPQSLEIIRRISYWSVIFAGGIAPPGLGAVRRCRPRRDDAKGGGREGEWGGSAAPHKPHAMEGAWWGTALAPGGGRTLPRSAKSLFRGTNERVVCPTQRIGWRHRNVG